MITRYTKFNTIEEATNINRDGSLGENRQLQVFNIPVTVEKAKAITILTMPKGMKIYDIVCAYMLTNGGTYLSLLDDTYHTDQGLVKEDVILKVSDETSIILSGSPDMADEVGGTVVITAIIG